MASYSRSVKDICGAELAGEIERIALQLYSELQFEHSVNSGNVIDYVQPKQQLMLSREA